MPTLEKVTNIIKGHEFCLTDCGPSEGCNPDDRDDYAPNNSESVKNN